MTYGICAKDPIVGALPIVVVYVLILDYEFQA
jgi:hypothetical protein